MKHLSALDVYKLMLKAKEKGLVKKYNKYGDVKARPAKNGEHIVTVIDGKVETRNTAKQGDYVLTGPAGENYIVEGKTFKARYTKVKTGVYKPIGSCNAFQYKGEAFEFKAPWGEKMLCEKGDYLASIESDLSDIYRIESSVFGKTYK